MYKANFPNLDLVCGENIDSWVVLLTVMLNGILFGILPQRCRKEEWFKQLLLVILNYKPLNAIVRIATNFNKIQTAFKS